MTHSVTGKRERSYSGPERVMQLLKRNGPADATTLASELHVTGAAIRQHLYVLRDRGWVTARDELRPMGRPAKIWELTAAADEYFPRADSPLVGSLLKSVQATLGREGMERVICGCVNEQVDRYQSALRSQRTLQAKLGALVAMRSEDGFMAEVRSEIDGSFLFFENHCPLAQAVENCADLCDAELKIFRAALGAEVSVERLEHMAGGDRRCAYRITRQPLKA